MLILLNRIAPDPLSGGQFPDRLAFQSKILIHSGSASKVYLVVSHIYDKIKTFYRILRACFDSSKSAADTDRFVTKEYLSKELLRYVLDMELLPEIEDLSTLPEK